MVVMMIVMIMMVITMKRTLPRLVFCDSPSTEAQCPGVTHLQQKHNGAQVWLTYKNHNGTQAWITYKNHNVTQVWLTYKNHNVTQVWFTFNRSTTLPRLVLCDSPLTEAQSCPGVTHLQEPQCYPSVTHLQEPQCYPSVTHLQEPQCYPSVTHLQQKHNVAYSSSLWLTFNRSIKLPRCVSPSTEAQRCPGWSSVFPARCCPPVRSCTPRLCRDGNTCLPTLAPLALPADWRRPGRHAQCACITQQGHSVSPPQVLHNGVTAFLYHKCYTMGSQCFSTTGVTQWGHRVSLPQALYLLLESVQLNSDQFKMVSMHSEISPMLPLKWFQCLSDWWWPSLVLSRKISWRQCYKREFLLSFLLFSSNVSITATKVIPSWIQMCHSSPWISIGMTTKDSKSKPSFKGTSPLKHVLSRKASF